MKVRALGKKLILFAVEKIFTDKLGEGKIDPRCFKLPIHSGKDATTHLTLHGESKGHDEC
jgi:hypothetical protein